jgi:hypothetical protein
MVIYSSAKIRSILLCSRGLLDLVPTAQKSAIGGSADEKHSKRSCDAGEARYQKSKVVAPVDAPYESGQKSNHGGANLVCSDYPTKNQANITGSENSRRKRDCGGTVAIQSSP